MEIKSNTIKEAWPKMLNRILSFGDIINITIDGKVTPTMELSEPLMVELKNPYDDMITEGGIWNNKQALEIYSNNVINNTESTFTYTYGERLRAFVIRGFKTGYYCSEFDQIEDIIDKLIYDRNSRQAIAITWKLPDDIEGEHPPCIISIDYTIRKGLLNCVVYIRSNDIFGAWPENAYMLARLNQYVSQNLDKVLPGKITIVSNKAHIYYWNIEEACKIVNLPKSADKILRAMGINKGSVKGIA